MPKPASEGTETMDVTLTPEQRENLAAIGDKVVNDGGLATFARTPGAILLALLSIDARLEETHAMLNAALGSAVSNGQTAVHHVRVIEDHLARLASLKPMAERSEGRTEPADSPSASATSRQAGGVAAKARS